MWSRAHLVGHPFRADSPPGEFSDAPISSTRRRTYQESTAENTALRGTHGYVEGSSRVFAELVAQTRSRRTAPLAPARRIGPA